MLAICPRATPLTNQPSRRTPGAKKHSKKCIKNITPPALLCCALIFAARGLLRSVYFRLKLFLGGGGMPVGYV